ncbi:hypothetical protein [Amycolatopsis granulosa]|uniref:hypothetical protein n=1 Tax=Amycolatopsis granulosa TaxID=185684 RepID=UPI0014232C6C|nr:hypothetical protein [Amycolatopsis granulosa]NIH87513.1 hypothetical protein [Amycolatopsis granulosa]
MNNYPVDPKEDDREPRFTFSLIHDVADLLACKGYPKVESSQDFVRLQQALYEFLYSTEFCHYF